MCCLASAWPGPARPGSLAAWRPGQGSTLAEAAAPGYGLAALGLKPVAQVREP